MPIELDKLFEPNDPNLGGEGSPEWNREIFQRAYNDNEGPFTKVSNRLSSGFSVLVYLPGNCMTAAAEYTKHTSNEEWSEYGKYPSDNVNISTVWNGMNGFVSKLFNWFSKKEGTKPYAIFHNLDLLLSDDKGGIYPHAEAQMALFSLIESTRNGVVLGLSDRNSGRLPGALERAFDEHVWIEEIAFNRFPFLISRNLGERLLDNNQTIPEGTAWLIASRLRWSDPIRAVKIMQNVAERQNELKSILEQIWKATRSVEFIDPDEAFTGDPKDITGFSTETTEFLQSAIIKPFQDWTNFTGNQKQCESKLRKLPPGLILFGPPGTGKTHLTRWIAKSIGVPVRVVNSADIKASLMGEAEKNMHNIFQQARRAAPCIIVLDDADDLFPDRSNVQSSTAGAERGIVDAALQELEGIYGRLEGVLVILTTNRFGALDPAIKARLRLYVQIPYPLDKMQIGEIVDSIATEYSFTLDNEVLDKLIERFFAPIIIDPAFTASIDTPEQRKKVESNLFSIREIQQALSLLDNDSPTLADVERMDKYYKQLVF